MKYEFQFLRKDLPFYVDVEANTVSQAVERANTIDNDIVFAPEFGSGESGIKRIVLNRENEHGAFTAEDICYIYDLEEHEEIHDIKTIPQ